ncbi:MAG TPA: phosphoribosylanthranilate isomerase [Chloroflexota bacterium]|nr:phosphoribosylanthranilate isomerase [Chloroflexota bacterium]
MVKVKICGVRRLSEAETALAYGADFLGFVFYPPSSRYVTPEEARALLGEIRRRTDRGDWAAVGVFVNEPAAWVNDVARLCGLDYVQLHGTESADYCARMAQPIIKALRLAEIDGEAVTAARYGATRLLLDSQVPGYWGGTGQRFDWAGARRYAGEALVAGGLTPDNVGEALDALRPWGLDVSSGVERGGVKDPLLIRAFLENARRWEVATHVD